MKEYLDLLLDIKTNGILRDDRTGVGTQGVFGRQLRIDLQNGFPLLTTKKIHFKSIIVELCWFMKGLTNVNYLKDRGVNIWNEWALPNGDLGPVYGKQWRDFNGVDQLKNLVNDLKNNPNSRRHIVSAWNPVDVPTMKLPPCHTLWQCYISEGKLSLHLYARSIDSFLGLPFNIASYACLIHILAEHLNLLVGDLIISFGDLHIYKNHFEQVNEQLSRTPTDLPTLFINTDREFPWNHEPEDFEILHYYPQAVIKAPIAV